MARLSELGIDFDHWCYACGRANPMGLHLEYDVARGRAETCFTPRREHTGYEGVMHGGIVTALLDETMGWAIFHQGIWGVTARITVTFRRPVNVGDELWISGSVTKEGHRAIETHGEIHDATGALLAEADGTFLVMPEERRRELERRYSRIDEAFAKVKAAVDAEEERDRVAVHPRRGSSTSGVEAVEATPRSGRRRARNKELEHGRT